MKKSLEDYALDKKISLTSFSGVLKARNVKTVCKTFHKGGLVVPFDRKTDVGYRQLSESDGKLPSSSCFFFHFFLEIFAPTFSYLEKYFSTSASFLSYFQCCRKASAADLKLKIYEKKIRSPKQVYDKNFNFLSIIVFPQQI